MSVACIHCGSPRGAETATQDGLQVCRQCHEVMGPEQARAQASRWALPWLQRRAWIPVVLTLVWGSFVLLWLSTIGPVLFEFGTARSLFNLFPLLCLVAVLGFGYFSLARVFNATRIDVRDGVLSIVQRPFPTARDLSVPITSVEAVRCRASCGIDAERTPWTFWLEVHSASQSQANKAGLLWRSPPSRDGHHTWILGSELRNALGCAKEEEPRT